MKCRKLLTKTTDSSSISSSKVSWLFRIDSRTTETVTMHFQSDIFRKHWPFILQYLISDTITYRIIRRLKEVPVRRIMAKRVPVLLLNKVKTARNKKISRWSYHRLWRNDRLLGSSIQMCWTLQEWIILQPEENLRYTINNMISLFIYVIILDPTFRDEAELVSRFQNHPLC